MNLEDKISLKWYTAGANLIAHGKLTHTIFYGTYTEKFHVTSGLEKSLHNTQLDAIKWCVEQEKNIIALEDSI